MTAPKREAVRAALERRARELLGDGAAPLDFACDYVANGKTLTQLASDLSAAFGADVSRETVRRALGVGEVNGVLDQRLREARAEGASALADEARQIADDVGEDRDAIAKAKLRVDTRQWTAARWNREMFGEQKPSTQISIGDLHIDAMRRVAALNATPRLPNAVAKVIIEGAEDAPDE